MKQDKKTLKRIISLLKDIDRNGHLGIGNPEQLKGDFLHIGLDELMIRIDLSVK